MPHGVQLAERERFTVIAGALMVLLLAALDQTIVAPALPTIGSVLGDVDWLAWVVTAYFLTATAVTPLYGRLADLRGRRPTLYGAVALFLIGSVVCALAPAMTWLIVGRAVQGLGGGGLITLVQTVIGDVVPPDQRARYMVYISTTWAVASICGPLAGGLFAEHLHWSGIFWINLPLGLVAFAMIHHALARVPDVRRPARLDLVGSALVVLATVSLMLALTWGGGHGWASPRILGLFALAGIAGGLFVRHVLVTEEALVPVHVLRDPVVAVVISALFFTMGAYVGLSVYVPVWLEVGLGVTPAGAGFGLLSLTLGTVVGAMASGRLMVHTRHHRRLVLSGAGLAIVATSIFAATCGSLGYWQAEALLSLIGIGTGIIFPVGTVLVQNAVARHDLGVAMGTLAFVRSLGSVVAVSVLGAVLATVGIGTASGAASANAHADPLAAGLFAAPFAAVVAGQVIGFVVLCFLEDRPLRGPEPPPEAGRGLSAAP